MRYGLARLLSTTTSVGSTIPPSNLRLTRLFGRRHVSSLLFQENVGPLNASRYRLYRCNDSKRRLSGAKQDDWTIYALSTAPGRSAIAIIRISGPACLAVCISYELIKAQTNNERYIMRFALPKPPQSHAKQYSEHCTILSTLRIS